MEFKGVGNVVFCSTYNHWRQRMKSWKENWTIAGQCPVSAYTFCMTVCFFLYIGLLGMTQPTRKLQVALRLILRVSGTDSLMSPQKDTKVNLLLNFCGRAECTRREINLCCKWDWNSGPFDLQSSAFTNRPPSKWQALPRKRWAVPKGWFLQTACN